MAALADWVSPAVHIAQVVLGIGALIFVHELGHFLVGRWTGVRAEAFSIGFGPVLLRWKPGPTEYRLSAVPLGGYVKFLGENPGEPGRLEPDSFPAATYPRKLVILLAGVTMNALTALVLFAGVFRVGVDLPAPRIGHVEPGSPAWEFGLRPGDEFVEVNGHRILDFEDIQQETVLADEVTVRIRRGGKILPPITLPTRPTPEGLRLLGIQPAIEQDGSFAVVPDGRAAKAGFRTGDRVVAVDGKPVDSLEGALRVVSEATRDTVWTVRRDGTSLKLTLPHSSTDGWRIGVTPDSPVIAGVLRDGPSWEAGLRPGDEPVSVGATPAPTWLSAQSAIDGGASGPFRVKRDGAEVDIPLPDGEKARAAFTSSFASSVDSSTWVSPWTGVPEPSPLGEAGMAPGSQILRIDGQPIDSFEQIVSAVQAAQERGTHLTVTWRQPDGTEREAVPITPTVVHEPDLGGIVPVLASVTVREPNVLKAMGLGVERTHRWVMRILSTLRSMIEGKIGRKVLAGPVAIARATYLKAEQGPSYLFLWLGVISMNLAVLNLLPIPLLDGGQILVLTAERVRGKPIPERVLEGVQWAGLAVILGLMVFVLSNDIINLFS